MGGKSTTRQENKPPEWAKPLFETSADEAMGLYQSGAGANTFLGPTVAPLSDTTMTGVNQLAQAGQGWDTAGTRPLYQQAGAAAVSNPFMSGLSNVAGGVQGGDTSAMAENLFGGIASGQDGITTGGDFRDIYGRAQQPTSAAQNLQGYASGENLQGEGNPFYRERLERDLADTASQVQSLYSGMGRYGSGANVEALSEALAGQRIGALENDWNREQANQFRATGMIDQANQGALNTQMGAVQGATGVEGQNLSNRLAASGQQLGAEQADFSRGLQADALQGNLLSNAGQMYSTGIGQGMDAANAMSGLDQRNFENRLAGAGATLQAGGMMDEQSQAQLRDEINKFYALDNEDWSRLGMLQGAAAGAAGPYGTQMAETRQSPGLAGILGGAGSLKG